MSDAQRLAVLSIGVHAVAIGLGWGVISHSTGQSHELARAAELSTLSNKIVATANDATNKAIDWARSWLFLDPVKPEESEYERAVALAGHHGRQALLLSVLLGTTAASFITFLHAVVMRNMPAGERLAVQHMCYTSLVLFGVGIGATALSLLAFKDMPVIGQVVFKFESKGIAQTIYRMFSSGNAVLGILILLFSIVVPLVKVALTFYASLTTGPEHTAAMSVIKAVGKWSMADVFVVSILLAFLAAKGDEFTDAWIGPGVYFFAAYCVLSIWAGWCLCMNDGEVAG